MMNYSKIRLVYFSPTQTTKKILESIAQGIDVEEIEHLDIGSSEFDKIDREEINDELAIIGIPVYGGRLPFDATKRLLKVKGKNSPAVIVVVYGNREFEDALLELRNIIVETGFKPFAAATFIGEHSFSSEKLPIAHGRPDVKDIAKAKEFGNKIKNLKNNKEIIENIVNVPGNYPYKEYKKINNEAIITVAENCGTCSLCIKMCPTNAIRLDKTILTDPVKCIHCFACIKNCKNKARININESIKASSEWLSKNCSVRKEPSVYINM